MYVYKELRKLCVQNMYSIRFLEAMMWKQYLPSKCHSFIEFHIA